MSNQLLSYGHISKENESQTSAGVQFLAILNWLPAFSKKSLASSLRCELEPKEKKDVFFIAFSPCAKKLLALSSAVISQ